MIGTLDTYAVIEQQVYSINDLNERESTWEAFEPIWCSLRQLSGAEGVANGTRTETVRYSLRTHYVPGVTSAMRVNIDGTYYNIVSHDSPFRARTDMTIEYTSHDRTD